MSNTLKCNKRVSKPPLWSLMLFMHFPVCQKFEHAFTHHLSRLNAFFSIGWLITSLDAIIKVIREICC